MTPATMLGHCSGAGVVSPPPASRLTAIPPTISMIISAVMIMTALRAVIAEAEKRGLDRQMLSAQVHATPFYERLGFEIVSGEYLDAGIPNVDMVRTRQ